MFLENKEKSFFLVDRRADKAIPNFFYSEGYVLYIGILYFSAKKIHYPTPLLSLLWKGLMLQSLAPFMKT